MGEDITRAEAVERLIAERRRERSRQLTAIVVVAALALFGFALWSADQENRRASEFRAESLERYKATEAALQAYQRRD